MRILIEEYQYKIQDISSVLHGIDVMESIDGKVKINYVGYYYNTLLNDCVFILPKVLLKDVSGQELVFGLYKPESILEINVTGPIDDGKKAFLYKFAVWIYRTIVVYMGDNNNESSIIYHTRIAQLGQSGKKAGNTFLDILLSLMQFNRENKNYIFTTVKNLKSGHNKIHWSRTIHSTTALLQDDVPLYLTPINKKRVVNFDEELLIIFFSIINYISNTYGFPRDLYCNFQLITGKRFDAYLNGLGLTRLRQIKYKYFSDKALQLWELCFAFFEESQSIRVNKQQQEYLLVKDFHIVFESIVDKLIGQNPLPDGMKKKQEDGKIVDHLFTAESLFSNEFNQYYIGDSKYYKMGQNVGPESVYKQYTYARNVIQWNLDIFNAEEVPESGIKLRDELTEGYNVVPNFFISAKLDETLDYSTDGLEKSEKEHNKHKIVHFKNRLFDRDTLLVFHYDVNFLFLISLYARKSALQIKDWQTRMRNRFRKEIQCWIEEDYEFYVLCPHEGLDEEEYICANFKKLIGKINKPYKNSSLYSLALDKSKQWKTENEELIEYLKKSFYVEKCALGQNPDEIFK